MKCVLVSLTALLLVGCDGDEPRVAPTALVAATTSDFDNWACAADRAALSLGKADRTLLSPDGAYLAMQSEVLELVSLSDGKRFAVPGAEPTLEGARWSPDSKTLGYLDRGAPMLARRDDGTAITVDVELPAPSVNYSAQAVEWSHDGGKVAFITRGLGVLANPDDGSAGIFSRSMLGSFASPWALTFSADDRMLAGLDSTAAGEHGVVMIDTQTLELREIKGVEYYSFLGWTGDDVFAVVWSISGGTALWLVPRDGGEPLQSNIGGVPSPVGSEIALYGDGLHLVDPASGGDRSLLPDTWNAQSLAWSRDGKAIAYDAGKHRGYVAADDGTRLFEGLGVLNAGGWLAAADPDDPTSSMRTQNLWKAGGARFAMRAPAGTAELVTRSSVRWLSDTRLAYASSDGVHYAQADGKADRVICTISASLVPPQGDTLDDRLAQ